MNDKLTLYLTDKTEKITLPGLRTASNSPIASIVAALDAILAISRTALIADTPEISELVQLSEDDQPVPPHLFAAHHITDIIDRLRLEIHYYNVQTEQHLQNDITKDLPF